MKHVVSRVSSYSPIGGHSVTRTELKYENEHKAQTAQKFFMDILSVWIFG